MRLLLSIFILAILLPQADAQQYKSRHYTMADGLPTNNIRKFFRDSRGYMWIGTGAGLVRFDGEEFVIYNTSDGLADSRVWDIDEDKDGNLWLALWNGGIARFDGYYFTNYTMADGLVHNSARKIKVSSRHNCVVVGTHYGFSILQNGQFINFNTLFHFSERLTAIEIVENDTCIIVYSNTGSQPRHQVITFENDIAVVKPLAGSPIENISVSSVFTDRHGLHYFGGRRDDLYIFNGTESKRFSHTGQVFSMAKDPKGTIWMASWSEPQHQRKSGLNKLTDGELINMNDHFGLSSEKGWQVMVDTVQNLLWYATLDDGFYIIPLPQFEYYPPVFFNEAELKIEDIDVDHKGNLWLLTNEKIIQFNHHVYQTILTSAELPEFEIPESMQWIKSHERELLSSMAIEDSATFWVRNSPLGIWRIQKTEAGLRYEQMPLGDGCLSIKLIDHDNLFIYGYWCAEALRLNTHSSKIDTIRSRKGRLHPVYIRAAGNQTWMCSRINGLYLYEGDSMICINDFNEGINSIFNSLAYDGDKHVYAAGNDGRIEVFNKDTRMKADEITVAGVKYPALWLEIDRDHLFAIYADGLRVFSLKGEMERGSHPRHYSIKDGFEFDQINKSMSDTRGNIWLATTNGLIRIMASEIIETQYAPNKTIIEEILVNGLPLRHINDSTDDAFKRTPASHFTLNSDESNISIRYKTFNFIDPEQEVYYFKTKGIDEDWVRAGSERRVVYTRLPPGNYQFQVKSLNVSTGIESEGASISFTIAEPWHATWWFSILVALLISGVTALAIIMRNSYRNRREAEKRDVLTRISQLETKALQSQMNPHFIFNSINSIQRFVLDNDVDLALGYLNAFSKLIRANLEYIDEKSISLKDELDYLRNYIMLEQMRFKDKFDFEMHIAEEVDLESAMISPMVIQPILENAIKHGVSSLKFKGMIRLEMEMRGDEKLVCAVEDNGIGRQKRKEQQARQKVKYESKGLKIVSERIRLMNKPGAEDFYFKIIDLHNEAGTPCGTRVELVLPVH